MARAVLLLVPLLCPGALRSPPHVGAQEPADLVVIGEVFTADPDRPQADAVAIRGELIVGVGSIGEMRRLVGKNTRILRTQGSVLPGFHDAHCHFTLAFGRGVDVDLTGADSLEEILTLVRDHAAAHPEDDVIEGLGWSLSDLPDDAFPSAGVLDAVVDDRPLLLWGEGPHGVWVNGRALESAGIDAATREPPGVRILRDEAGEPTGVLLGRELPSLFPFVAFPGPLEIRDGLRRGLVEANRLGITSIQEAVPPPLVPFLAELFDEGELTVRCHVWGRPARGTMGGPEEHARWGKLHGREEWITFGTLAEDVDGEEGLRTAALLAPYADDPTNTGLLVADPERLGAEVAEANARGIRVALHATGDAAVRTALAALAEVESGAGVRNRIEHALIVHPKDVPRLARAGVVLSVQPALLARALASTRRFERSLGPKRSARVLPLRTLSEAGVTLAFGSDFPLAPLDPLVGLHAAVTRESVAGRPEGGWVPDERLSLAAALLAATRGPAVAEGTEDEKGRLVEGALADLVVFEEDLFRLPQSRLLRAEVKATIVGGRVVYNR